MQTAKTSEILAQELEKIGLPDLARKARANEYHDFFSESATPSMDLAKDLGRVIADCPEDQLTDVIDLRNRHIYDGEFDASLEESQQWMESREGQETFGELLKGAKKAV